MSARFFNNAPMKDYRVLLPFIKDGFACGHKAIHVVKPRWQHHPHLQRLAAEGIGTPAALQNGQFELLTNTEKLTSATAASIRIA